MSAFREPAEGTVERLGNLWESLSRGRGAFTHLPPTCHELPSASRVFSSSTSSSSSSITSPLLAYIQMPSPVPSTDTAFFLILPQTLASRPTSDTVSCWHLTGSSSSNFSRPTSSTELGGDPSSIFCRGLRILCELLTTLSMMCFPFLNLTFQAIDHFGAFGFWSPGRPSCHGDEPDFGHVDQNLAHTRTDKHLSCARLQHSRASTPNALGVPPANFIAIQNCLDLSTDSAASPTGTLFLSGRCLQFSTHHILFYCRNTCSTNTLNA